MPPSLSAMQLLRIQSQNESSLLLINLRESTTRALYNSTYTKPKVVQFCERFREKKKLYSNRVVEGSGRDCPVVSGHKVENREKRHSHIYKKTLLKKKS